MSGDDEVSKRDEIARDQGYDSYEDAPLVVQNVIDSVVEGAWTEFEFESFNDQYGDLEDEDGVAMRRG